MLIVFEGCEGCGKTTQAERLSKRLARADISFLLTREPGGTKLGDQVRALVKKSKGIEISPLAELFLFLASRAQLVTEVVIPGIQRGVVICDRYAPSTLAYQGSARGVDSATINTLNHIATSGLEPDLVILLDIPPVLGLSRSSTRQALFSKQSGQDESSDRFEEQDIAFHEYVRQSYLEMARVDPSHWTVIDASLSEEDIENLVWNKVEQLVSTKRSIHRRAGH